MKKVELYKHNKTTYDNITKIFETGNRCAVVQPTGSGKSWLIMALAQDNPDKRIVVFEPNRYIISRVSEQMKEYNIENVEFLTYQKLIRMSDDEILNIKADYICLDELHRIAAKEWGKCVDTLFKTFSETKFLGLTATPNRTDNINIIDDFAGELACNISLGDAIVNRILPTSTYISALYTFDEEIAKVEKKIDNSTNTDEEKDDMRKALTVAKHNLELSCGVSEILKKHIPCANGKYIVFCQNIDHLNNIRPTVLEWFNNAGFEVNGYAVHSKNAEKDKQFKAFDSDNSDRIKLLFCIAMLNEGVHLDNISGVILLRPTISSIIYFQQIGRAISASKLDNPIIFDLVNNADCVGYSSLVEEIETAVERNKAEDGENCDFNINDFHVYDYISDCVNVLSEIENRCVDEFDFRLKQLKEYKTKWGHCCVMKDEAKEWEGFYGWACYVRNNSSRYSKYKIDLLNKCGFVWDIKDWKRNRIIRYIKEYKLQNDSSSIKKDYMTSDGFHLGVFLDNLKTKNKSGNVDSELINELSKLGIVLERKSLDEIWMDCYHLAYEYVCVLGNTIKSDTKYKNHNIGSWLNTNKKLFRKGELLTWREELIKNICNLDTSLNFDDYIKIIQECLSCGKKLTRRTKHNGVKIGIILGDYKQRYKQGKFPEERYQQLLSLGIDLAKEGGYMADPV